VWLYESPGAFKNMLLWVNHRYLQPSRDHNHSGVASAEAVAGSNSPNDDDGDDGGGLPSVMAAAGVGGSGAGLPQRGQPLPLYVTENGCSAPGESEAAMPAALNDAWRVRGARHSHTPRAE
jgi:hypothetical protein